MKILLLGEFSGLHLYLKQGLEKLGHDVTLLANHDGAKKIPGADDDLYYMKSNGLKKIFALYIEPLLHMHKYSGYDVIQFISPVLFSPIINTLMIKKLKKKTKCLTALVAGDGYHGYVAWENGVLKPSYFDDNSEYQSRYDGLSAKSRSTNKAFIKGYNLVDAIIPSIPYLYVVPYKEQKNLSDTIMFPINLENVVYSENVVTDKLVFFHGITRPNHKGSKYIAEAMEYIKKKYPNDVECISVSNLPFIEYQQVMKRTNVVLDQCKTYGFGINGCIAMAQGKVLMTSLRDEVVQEGDLYDCPAIHIEPNVDDIIKKMEYIIHNKLKIIEMGRKGREYIEKKHNYISKAHDYLDCWNRIIELKGDRQE